MLTWRRQVVASRSINLSPESRPQSTISRIVLQIPFGRTHREAHRGKTAPGQPRSVQLASQCHLQTGASGRSSPESGRNRCAAGCLVIIVAALLFLELQTPVASSALPSLIRRNEINPSSNNYVPIKHRRTANNNNNNIDAAKLSTATVEFANEHNNNNDDDDNNNNNNDDGNDDSGSPDSNADSESESDSDNSNQSSDANSLLRSDHLRRIFFKSLFVQFLNKNLNGSLRASATVPGHNAFELANEPEIQLPSSPPYLAGGAGGSGAVGQPLSNQETVARNASTTATTTRAPTQLTRPYFGDAFYSFNAAYLPIHCVICLIICTLGVFANVTNIVVLTRPNMVSAVNVILSAIAFSDLIVNISNIPYLIHEMADSSAASAHSFQWALYVLFHAHTTVTAHTISIWLTCVLATWRYFVVCRSQSSNQRNWSVNMAKRTIIAVFLLVPIFCIPNYLSFAILEDHTDTNSTIYKVDFSHLAERYQFIKTFIFSTFSCLTKLVPCVLLTFFTTALIRKLLSAHERRLRLASYGNASSGKEANKCGDGNGKKAILTESCLMSKELQRIGSRTDETGNALIKGILVDASGKSNDTNQTLLVTNSGFLGSRNNENGSAISSKDCSCGNSGGGSRVQLAQQLNSSCAPDTELVAISCNGSQSSLPTMGNMESIGSPKSNDNRKQQANHARILTQLIVEKTPTSAAISTTAASTKLLASSDMDDQRVEIKPANCNLSPSPTFNNHVESPRSASTCGALEIYSAPDTNEVRLYESQSLVQSPRAASQEFSGKNLNISPINNRRSLGGAINMMNDGNFRFGKRSSETNSALASRLNRGSAAITPIQLVKLQAAQRQLSQNETTTKLLIAVMIVFLICEFPAGILAALCAVLGEGFIDNVYRPTGILTDLLALINSSVNFILYCCMSTQFRTTFYKVVLHC